jgi:hypothetical protein
MAEAMHREFMSTRDGATALQVYVQGLTEGRWDDSYLEQVGQQHRGIRSRWSIQEIAAFAHLHSALMAGNMFEVEISARGEPGPDSDREGNAAKIGQLPGPFVATVSRSQRNADQDGWLYWDEPIKMEKSVNVPYTDGVHGTQPIRCVVDVPPGRVPLEIGTTKPSRTLLHCRMDGGVARWPYGHNRLILFMSAMQLPTG